MITATVVLLTKNAEAYLPETLEAILEQDADFGFEILVIDSGSIDKTLGILASFPVRTINIRPESFNHGETRNLGAREANPESEFIVYLSQDAKPHNNKWLQNLIAPFSENPEIAGTFSRHVPRPNATAPVVRQLASMQTGGQKQLVKKMPESIEEYNVKKFFYIYFSNTSSALRRSVWNEISFDKVSFAEDAVWADKVLRQGYSLVFEPSSIVLHSHSYNPVEQFRQSVDHTHAMNVLFQPPFYKSRRLWFRIFAGIPLQVAKDCKFVVQDPFFANKSFWRKGCMMAFSLPWQFATAIGAWVGAHLEYFPPRLRLLFSRQERIRLL